MLLIDWTKFLPALVLLLTPMALFHGRRVRHRALPQDWQHYWGRTFSLGLHSIDLGRAILGAWNLADALTLKPDVSGFAQHAPLMVQVSVLIVACILQTFICREPGSAHAPFAFVSGIVLGFLPPTIAGFSLLLALVAALGTRAPTAFFPLLALALLAMEFVLDQSRILPSVAGLAFALTFPWVLVLLFPRQWVVTVAPKRTTGAAYEDPGELK